MENQDNKTGAEAPLAAKEVGTTVKQIKSEQSFKIFNSSIKRANNLLNINFNELNEKLPIPEDKLLDAYRAVILLSIASLDAYVKTFVRVEIKQRLTNWDLTAELKDYIKEDLFGEKELLQYVLDHNFSEKVIEKFNQEFDKKSFQSQQSIDKYMKIAGFKEVFKQISSSADRNNDKLLKDLDKFTGRRHLIAHCGDHDLSQTETTEKEITFEDASNCVALVTFIANEIHKLNQKK